MTIEYYVLKTLVMRMTIKDTVLGQYNALHEAWHWSHDEPNREARLRTAPDVMPVLITHAVVLEWQRMVFPRQ